MEESVLPFTLNENSVRGRIGYLDNSINECLTFHSYPSNVSKLIAQSLMVLVLIGDSIKLKWKISLQIRSEGTIKIICVDYFAPQSLKNEAKIRAYASFKKKINCKVDPFKLLGSGILTISIDQGDGKRPYQGITKLVGNKISDSVSAFFTQSEQIPTFFKIETKSEKTIKGKLIWKAFGIMIQGIPDERNNIFNKNEYFLKLKAIIENFNFSKIISERFSQKKVLERLFYNDNCIIFKKRNVSFGCTCNKKKVIVILMNLDRSEVHTLKNKKGHIFVNCEFCGKNYIIKENEISYKK